jgi:hypothetical protein
LWRRNRFIHFFYISLYRGRSRTQLPLLPINTVAFTLHLYRRNANNKDEQCFNTNSNTHPHCTAHTCAHIKCSTCISLPQIGSHLSYAGNKNWEKRYNGLDSKDEIPIGKHLERINDLTATPIWGEVFRDAPGGRGMGRGRRWWRLW